MKMFRALTLFYASGSSYALSCFYLFFQATETTSGVGRRHLGET